MNNKKKKSKAEKTPPELSRDIRSITDTVLDVIQCARRVQRRLKCARFVSFFSNMTHLVGYSFWENLLNLFVIIKLVGAKLAQDAE